MNATAPDPDNEPAHALPATPRAAAGLRRLSDVVLTTTRCHHLDAPGSTHTLMYLLPRKDRHLCCRECAVDRVIDDLLSGAPPELDVVRISLSGNRTYVEELGLMDVLVRESTT